MMTEGNDGLPVRLTPEQAQQIREEHFLINLPNAMFSTLFLCQLLKLRDQRILGTHEIADEIRALERGQRRPGTRPPDQFRHPPLKGLWKKHFFSAAFMLRNLGNAWGLGKGGNQRLDEMLEQEFAAEQSGYFTEALASRIAHRLVIGGYSDRAGASRLTGEWIVFAKHAGSRFYLTLAGHEEDDEAIHRRLVEWCQPEFRFLTWG